MGVLDFVSSVGSTVREEKPAGIKSAFGLLGLNVAAAAASIGLEALARKTGTTPPFVPAGQAQVAALTTPPGFIERQAAIETFKTPVLVGVIGIGVLVVAYVATKIIRGKR